MRARPFRLLGAAEIDHLQARLTAAVEAWRADWLPGHPTAEVRCASAKAGAGDAADRRWLTVRAGEAALHVGQSPAAAQALSQALFGAAASRQPSGLAAEVADSALAALAMACLPGASAETGPGPTAADRLPGSGAVDASIVWPGLELRQFVDGAATGRLLADRPRPAAAPLPPLVRRRSVIGNGRVELRASIGQVEMDVATLASLAPGDVIRLDLGIDEPLRLTIGGQPTTRRAYLGAHGGRRALSLTAVADLPSSKVPEASHVRSE